MKYIIEQLLKYIVLSYIFGFYHIHCYSQELSDDSVIGKKEIVHFESGKYEIEDSHSTQLLNFIANLTNSEERYYFFISAHTDDVGAKSSNLDLSNRRKNAVQNFLVQNGINYDFITAYSYGENKLAIKSKDPISRRFNRRVEIWALSTSKFKKEAGQLIDLETNKGIPGIVKIETSSYTDIIHTDTIGNFTIALPLDEIAKIEYYAKNYFFETRLIRNGNLMDRDVSLRQARIGSKIILKDINFYGNKNVMLPSANTNFNQLLNFMRVNDKICIELSGHINSYGYEFLVKDDLSIARALIVNEKLKNAGIEPNRLIARGYGDLKKLFPEPKNVGEMEANMRVEIIVIDCDSSKHLVSDTLAEAKHYSNIVLDRKFDKKTAQHDLSHFYDREKREILFYIRSLQSKGIDPTSYTYAHLLNEGKALKYKDNKVAQELRKIFVADQELRSMTKDIENLHGYDSDEFKNHWRKIKLQDSINLTKVELILKQQGWLGPDKVSKEGNEAIFLVIQHSNLKTQEQYLPLMREAVKQGNAKGQDLALLEDRVAIANGKKQIYGSQIHRDKKNGNYYVAPIENPKEVNSRRKAVGLNTIETYVLRWNIIWKNELIRMENEN